jgi:hypothetical protein
MGVGEASYSPTFVLFDPRLIVCSCLHRLVDHGSIRLQHQTAVEFELENLVV